MTYRNDRSKATAGDTTSRTGAASIVVASDTVALQEWFDLFAATVVPTGHEPPAEPVALSTLYAFLNDFIKGGPYYPGRLPPPPPHIEYRADAPNLAGDIDHRADPAHNATHGVGYKG